jgi:type I restriction enzyme M protein
MFGQELNAESYAICKADMLIKGQDVRNIALGNTLSNDAHADRKFDYMLSNPPFGVDWDKVEAVVRREHKEKGAAGRFGPGLPRSDDGAMLFLLHLLSKMRPAKDGGSRIGIVLNGSPLFSGGAGSGGSDIRRYVIENDLLEAIVGLPTDMFFNTGLATYIWILTNRKPSSRKGRVQLVDASALWEKLLPKNLGSKRRVMSDSHIATVTRLFGDFVEADLLTITDPQGKVEKTVVARDAQTPTSAEGVTTRRVPVSKIFRNEEFGYRSITIERPLLDENGTAVRVEKGKNKGQPLPDVSLRETENVPLLENIEEYFKREVAPHAQDAWIDHAKTKLGYEIPFNLHFYAFQAPRSLAMIDGELKRTVDAVRDLLEELSA